MARTKEEGLQIDALGALIHTARKSGIDIAESVWAAGYRLDPYPDGKSKQELIARIEAMEAELDKARNLLRSEHAKLQVRGMLIRQEDAVTRHRKLDQDCLVCKFLKETSTVKS